MTPNGFLQRTFNTSSQFISRVEVKAEAIGNAIADKYEENRNPATFVYRGAQLYAVSMAAGLAKMPALAAREASKALINRKK